MEYKINNLWKQTFDCQFCQTHEKSNRENEFKRRRKGEGLPILSHSSGVH